jgi:hypothetical protein
MERVLSGLVMLLVGLSSATGAASADNDDKAAVRLAWVDGPTWYAIAGSYRTKREADHKAARLGDPWIVSNSNICENYAKGIWMVVAGAFNGQDARSNARKVGGYA